MQTYSYDVIKAAKNFRKHRVSLEEAITVFADPLHSVVHDDQHSIEEQRWIMLGQSTRRRILFVVYTETDSSVRLIGARVATANERKQYEEVD